MVKQRMTALDVGASVDEMRTELHGLRLLNIYDISPKMFLFKFGHGENKKTLLLESGVRIHLTHLVREKPKVPSQFTMRLRKHVRAWRLESVTRLNHDRTVDFRFGVDENASYHIIVELFAKGNILLTDHEYRILLLLRAYKDNDIKISVHELYPVSKSFEEHYQQQQGELKLRSLEEEQLWRTEALRREWHSVFARHADHETTRSTLSAVYHFGPTLADHILTVAGVKNVKKGEMKCDAETMFTQLLPGMLEAWTIAFSAMPNGGYLIRKNKNGKKCKDSEGTSVIQCEEKHTGRDEEAKETLDVVTGVQSQLKIVQYDDFSPVFLAQYNADNVVTSFLPSFGSVCDAFFLHTETQKIEQHNEKNVTSACSKKEKFEREHERRLRALELEEQENQRKGECIIKNAEKIDEAIGLINGALAAGIQWEALRSLLRRRHAEGHPVAYMVHELFLERNSISVLVEASEEEDGDVEEGEEGKDCMLKPYVIEVDLGKTAYANATTYFGRMKANRVKHEKTVAATAKAMAGAEKKGERLAAKLKSKKAIVKARHRFWWEKFLWFRTSCGDYVLQGRDAQTTEILVRRVMQLGDVFVHCDVDGAFPCVLRPVGSAWTNACAQEDSELQQAPAGPLHMASLEEAGAWCVSRSSAWQSKFSLGAWWVYASQITGGTATGCYLFEGEKHYLRPQPLSLACGLLFRVSLRKIDPNNHEELPNFISKEDRCIFGEDDYENSAFLPLDNAIALYPMPVVEDVRCLRRRQQQQKQQQQKSQKQEQQERQQQRHFDPAGKGLSNKDETLCKNASFSKSKLTSLTKIGSGGEGGGNYSKEVFFVPKGVQQLTKHQRRKLKKIQEKYKDQDVEDCLYGAFLNGNQLSIVQQELLVGRLEKQLERSVPMPQEQFKNNGDNSEEEKEARKMSNSANEKKVDGCFPFSVHGDNMSFGKDSDHNQHDQAGQSQLQQCDKAISIEETRAVNNAELRREWQHFTSHPQPTDTVEYAVAVCAPMSSVVSYKYRAELSCGTAKKGQVVTSLKEHFAAMARGDKNESEINAVLSLEANDLMEQLRGNLKRLSSKPNR